MALYDLRCTQCAAEFLDIYHSVHEKHPVCTSCGAETERLWRQAPSVVGDDLPGGYYVRHGLCWPDGTPRRFDSKSAIRKAAFESGLTVSGETPRLNQRLVEKEQRDAERQRDQQA